MQMAYTFNQFLQINHIIEKLLFDIRQKCQKFAKFFFDSVNSNNFNNTLKLFQEKFSENIQRQSESIYNQMIASVLSQIKGNTNEDNIFEKQSQVQIYSDESAQCRKQQNQQKIIVKKESERQNDQQILNKWREARGVFFNKQIQTKLNEAVASEEDKQQIISLFSEQQYDIDLNQLCQLKKYMTEIQSLKSSLQSIEDYYQNKQQQCLPLQQTIKDNITTLKVIHISYQQQLSVQANYCCQYVISAFELFKIIYKNQLLNQVTLKGVQIQQFPKFIHLLNRVMNHQAIQQQYQQQHKDQLIWMKNFNYSKTLKLSIHAKVEFHIDDRQNTLSKIDDLLHFRSLFYQLNDIRAEIWLGDISEIHQWDLYLQNLWKCLRKIRKIKILISGNYDDQFDVVRFVLESLASFKEITQISFSKIYFSSQLRINDFLVIEYTLSILFKNNEVARLELYNCRNFPIFPQITTLQSIYLKSVTFRKQFEFINKICRTNRMLRSINYLSMEQDWKIDQNVFNQLDNLIISDCSHSYFGEISYNSLSSIKHLQIYNSSIGKADGLFFVFPKLVHLTILQLGKINIGYQHFYIIPSPNLKQLQIYRNNAITDRDLKAIDQKWPYLRNITLSNHSLNRLNVISLLKMFGVFANLKDQFN